MPAAPRRRDRRSQRRGRILNIYLFAEGHMPPPGRTRPHAGPPRPRRAARRGRGHRATRRSRTWRNEPVAAARRVATPIGPGDDAGIAEAPRGLGARGTVCGAGRRASSTSASTAATSKSIASASDVGACRAAKSVATRSAIRRSRPRRPRNGGVVESGIRVPSLCAAARAASRYACGGSRRRSAGHRPRPAGRAIRVGLAQPEGVVPVGRLARAVPRHASTPSAAASSSSSSRSPRPARTSRARGHARSATGSRSRPGAG